MTCRGGGVGDSRDKVMEQELQGNTRPRTSQLTSSVIEPINRLGPWDCHLFLIFCELQAWGAIDLHQLEEKEVMEVDTLFLSHALVGAGPVLISAPSTRVPAWKPAE